ncbi:MAG: hypothetical protein M1319_01610, partial [Chloroflexi bacterium]|nr:hypothetical protein [Chloroflexota bacterium]
MSPGSPLALTDEMDALESRTSSCPAVPDGGVSPRLPAVAIHTLGCKVNQSETDQMLARFRRRGFRLSAPGEAADVYVINTCTVTHIADRKSRQLIRRAKGENPDSLVVVTGCYASTSGREVEGLEEVDIVVPKVEQVIIADLVAGALGLPLVGEAEGASGHPAFSEHHRTRAFVKIQDGCDAHCTYCIVPTARGASVSIPPAQILEEIGDKLGQGYKEIVLAGVSA